VDPNTKVESNPTNKSIQPNQILKYSLILIIPYALFSMDFIGWFQKLTTGTDSTPSDLGYVFFGFIITSICLLILPALLVKKYYKRPFGEIGTHWGNKKLGLLFFKIGFIAIPLMFMTSNDPQLIGLYPLTKDCLTSIPLFIIYEILYGVLYYLPYEFFFRGFIQTGLSKTWSVKKSVIFVTILTTLLHLPKPPSEIIGALFVGILFGYLAYKTDSWFYVFGIHLIVGIATDTFCALQFLGAI
jgi:membrane protease YdiL (CAAX protease family)